MGMSIFVIRTLNLLDGDQTAPYDDILGRQYHYDSNVANSKAMGVGDVIVLRGNGQLVGISRISEVITTDFMKEFSRCTECGSTEISYRKRGNDYRCVLCKAEFTTPNKTQSPCVGYMAKYGKLWTPFISPIPVKEGDLQLSGYRTNAIRKMKSILDLARLVAGSGQDGRLLEFLSSPRSW